MPIFIHLACCYAKMTTAKWSESFLSSWRKSVWAREMTSPTRITAEWTVRAQLTITRPDDKYRNATHTIRTNESIGSGTTTTTERFFHEENPIRVVYKWCSDSDKTDTIVEPTNSLQSTLGNNRNRGRSETKHETYRSVGEVQPSDSGFSTATTANTSQSSFNPKCRSTCNIVLSACTDIIPEPNELTENLTTTYYTIIPSIEEQPQVNSIWIFSICQRIDLTTFNFQSHSLDPDVPKVNVLSVKDAFSQTSDVESPTKPNSSFDTLFHENFNSRAYGNNQRRMTESLLPLPKSSNEEGYAQTVSIWISLFSLSLLSSIEFHIFLAFKQPSTTFRKSHSPQRSNNIASPGSIQSPPSSNNDKSLPKKQPRTVHIDVYCTGSDAEESSSESSQRDDSSTSSDHSSQSQSLSPQRPIFNDNESNSTPQTVFDSDEMKLHHTRVANKSELPRRIAAQTQRQATTQPTPGNLREYLLAQSDSKDEVNESKQILFDKHIGELPTTQPKHGRFAGARQRFSQFRRDQSDDGISSNYPNSSHSTIRDLTCSSVSSNLAASNSIITEDTESCKEPESDFAGHEQPSTIDVNVARGDSFEYERVSDQLRKRQMENRWKSHTRETDIVTEMPAPVTALYDESDPIYEFDRLVRSMEAPKYIRKAMTPSREATAHYEQIASRGISIDMHKWPYNANDFHQKPRRTLFGPAQGTVAQSSVFQRQIAGYTREHLVRAQKFGSVIEAIRKPGHHVGPAKNPDCQCEHCRRWFADRENYRSRASSLGNISFNRSQFWLTRHNWHSSWKNQF